MLFGVRKGCGGGWGRRMHGLEALQLCFGLAPCPLCPLLGERILDLGENTPGISGLKGETRSLLLKQLHTAAQ